jgi:hypothetical protein
VAPGRSFGSPGPIAGESEFRRSVKTDAEYDFDKKSNTSASLTISLALVIGNAEGFFSGSIIRYVNHTYLIYNQLDFI